MSDLPKGWSSKESKSRGCLYYINNITGETQWEVPTHDAVGPGAEAEIRVRHILKKHEGSRRPSSWRCEVITQSKETSIQQINGIKQKLIERKNQAGDDAMHSLFMEIAQVESDCSSAREGGDLGFFGRGKMQKQFEVASYSLQVGELSNIVDSDSGIHIILRIA